MSSKCSSSEHRANAHLATETVTETGLRMETAGRRGEWLAGAQTVGRGGRAARWPSPGPPPFLSLKGGLLPGFLPGILPQSSLSSCSCSVVCSSRFFSMDLMLFLLIFRSSSPAQRRTWASDRKPLGNRRKPLRSNGDHW